MGWNTCCSGVGNGPSVLRDLILLRGSAPGDAAPVAADMLRWLQYFAGTHLFKDPSSALQTALMSPIKTETFKAAERLAVALPAPLTQWSTIAAMAWDSWPALEMTLTVGLLFWIHLQRPEKQCSYPHPSAWTLDS